MKVTFRAIRDEGIQEKEGIVFEVKEQDEIGQYAVFRSVQLEGGKVSARVRNVFWFPDKKVNKGDLVVLYTKTGVQSEHKNDDGSISHFFYWGLGSPIWGDLNQVPILLVIAEWTYFKRDEKTK